MSEVVLENLTKKFGSFVAIDNISLRIEPHEFFVLLGPSGSGKSTLLRLIAGLEQPTSGLIYIDGKVVNSLPPKERDIAMVFQNYALYPHFTVYDNIALPLKVRGQSKSQIDAKVRDVASMLHIEDLLQKKPGQLSGGQQQRVALARALVRDPKLFLLDEPLSNLDAKLRVEARAFLKELQERLGVTTIYVTHDQSEAMSMATRIAVLNKGKVMQIADPFSIYRRPANMFTAGFIGSPSMNFIEGALKKDGEWSFVAGGLRVELPGLSFSSERRAIMGFRPEHIRIADEGIEATVSLVEPMGSIIYLHLNLGGFEVIAQHAGERKIKEGDKVKVRLDPESLLFYDAESGDLVS